MDSIWTQTAVFPSFPALEGDLRADAAIVGGGLTGILTAWLLRQAGADVVVLEADRVGGGQTAGTTAKLTAQQGLKYSQLLETSGEEAASHEAGADLAAVGEVGLSGEVRSINSLNMRLTEISRLGFKRCVIPAHIKDDIKAPQELELIAVKDIREAIRQTLG